MLCPHCEAPCKQDARFCPSCGHRLHYNEVSTRNVAKKARLWWCIPLFIFLLLTGALLGIILAEEKRTEAAIHAFKKGEHLANKGKYQQAQQLFTEALNKRQNFPTAILDKTVVTLALAINKDLTKIDQYNKAQHYEEALAQIDQSENKLESYDGQVIQNLKKRLSTQRVNTMVTQLRQQMKNKQTIDALAPILQKAEDLNVPEAKKIADEVRSQIVEIAYNKASNLLKDNQFSEALKAVTDGLSYDKDNKKLLKLQTTIKNAENAFADAEQQRLEKALAAAEKERQHNKNDAVQLVKIHTKLNDYGDVVVSGTIKSDATVPISMVEVAYTLTDKNGKEVTKNKVYATPDKLYPGDTGHFDYTHMMENKALKVAVTGFTWYVDN